MARPSGRLPEKPAAKGIQARLSQLVFNFANFLAGGSVIDTRQFGSEGEGRYTPKSPGSSGYIHMPYDGKDMALAIRYDDVDYETYDAARFYPVLRDCINVVVSAVSRAGCHFVSSNEAAVQLANTLIKPHVRSVNENLTRGALQFGNQVAEMVEEYVFDVKTSNTQSDAGTIDFEFPVAVGIKKFVYFDPQDTILLIDSLTGDFGGIKQYVPTLPGRIDIPASKLLHYVNDQEYGSVYGFAQTKSAIPFVRLVERFWDDMAKWADLFGAPYKVAKYRPGFTPTGTKDENGVYQKVDNRDIAMAILESLNSGASVAIASEFDPVTNMPLWGVDLLEVKGDGAQHYVEMIKLCNDMIRTAFGIPGYATSESPEKGTYTLGKSMIDLFLRNVNSRLDSLKAGPWDDQYLKHWNTVNFGENAPPIVIEFEPPDVDAAVMLLTAMIQNSASGKPLIDGYGQQITPDWSSVAQSVGLPVLVSKPKPAPVLNQVNPGQPGQKGVPNQPPNMSVPPNPMQSNLPGQAQDTSQQQPIEGEADDSSPAGPSGG